MASQLSSSLLADSRLFSSSGLALYAGSVAVLAVAYFLYTIVYNIFFHPLKHIPGPLLSRASGLTYVYRMRTGSLVAWLKEAHDKYGDAVRVHPNEVSFISTETAWQGIYGFRIGKHKNTGSYLKDRNWYPINPNGKWSMISADDADHSRMRRNVAHAFSDKALRGQEAILQTYADLLVHRLGEKADKPVDIMRWYNYTTFDVISDLTFGEPLYCLRDSQEHIWINFVLASVRMVGINAVRKKFPIMAWYDKLRSLVNDDASIITRNRQDYFRISGEKVNQRLDQETTRPDFFTSILGHLGLDEKAMTRDEMYSTANLFLSAGSETTATTLSGVTYLLLANPHTYARAVHEVRSTFNSLSDITLDAVNKLDYMIACLSEGLRYYPPLPTGFPRVVPAGGDTISGVFVPPGTSVYVSQHASNHSERNFRDPQKYAPERWLGDERYKEDKREGMQPFSFGPRNCLGKNLAYAEMRLILAKVLWSFDLELTEGMHDWMGRQKVFTLWDKPSLMVKLTPVQREG